MKSGEIFPVKIGERNRLSLIIIEQVTVGCP
jgi:hypothetical protein